MTGAAFAASLKAQSSNKNIQAMADNEFANPKGSVTNNDSGMAFRHSGMESRMADSKTDSLVVPPDTIAFPLDSIPADSTGIAKENSSALAADRQFETESRITPADSTIIADSTAVPMDSTIVLGNTGTISADSTIVAADSTAVQEIAPLTSRLSPAEADAVAFQTKSAGVFSGYRVQNDTVLIKTGEEFDQPGWLDLNKLTVHLSVFQMVPRETFARRFEGSAPKIIDFTKDNTTFVLIHELEHLLRRLSISRAGFSIDQLIQFNILDELNSRCAELLYRREIFIQTKSIDAAFAGTLPPPMEFHYLDNTYTGQSELYAKWLLKNGDKLGPVPTQEDIDAILTTAAEMVSSQLSGYTDLLPKVVESDILANAKVYGHSTSQEGLQKYAESTENAFLKHYVLLPPTSYDQAVTKLFTKNFGDTTLCLLTACSDKVRKKFVSIMKYFTDYPVLKNNLKYMKLKYIKYDKQIEQYREMQNIPDENSFEVNAPKKKTSPAATIAQNAAVKSY